MTKVLFITANPNDVHHSVGMATGQAFIEEYRKNNETDDITTLDLYNIEIPNMDTDVFSAMDKMRSGQPETLTTVEQAKLSRINELNEQFISADKLVFVTPLWNLSSPAIVKTYIDAIAVVGKNFRYSKEGSIGLLHGKKVLHIQARGGFYSQYPLSDMEMGNRYLKQIMAFFGITEFEELFIEGQFASPDLAEEIKAAGIKRAIQVGQTF